jgi:tetratricopeptide (TPR) repeat protein
MTHRFPSILLLLAVAIPVHAAQIPLQGSRDTLVQRLQTLYSEGSYREAIRPFERLPMDSLTAKAAYYVGSSYAALGDIQNSIRYLRRAVTLDPAHSGHRLQLARIFAQGGMVREARTEYEDLIAGDSSYVPALTSYGMLLFDEAEYAGAAAAFERSLTRNPRDYAANFYFGSSLERLGRTDSAMTFLAASMSLNPSYSPAVNLLAALYYRRQEYNQALLLYERLCKQHPKNAAHWYRAGLCSERLNGERLAIDLFRRAAALDTTEALYQAHLGQVYFGLGLFDSSVAAYREAVLLDPDNPILHLNLGLCLVRMDSTEEAIAALKRSAASHHIEKAALVYNQLGALLYNKKRFREARSAYASALAYNPRNCETLFFLGFTYDQMHDPGSARAVFARYLKAAAGDVTQKQRIETVRRQLKKLAQRQ